MSSSPVALPMSETVADTTAKSSPLPSSPEAPPSTSEASALATVDPDTSLLDADDDQFEVISLSDGEAENEQDAPAAAADGIPTDASDTRDTTPEFANDSLPLLPEPDSEVIEADVSLGYTPSLSAEPSFSDEAAAIITGPEPPTAVPVEDVLSVATAQAPTDAATERAEEPTSPSPTPSKQQASPTCSLSDPPASSCSDACSVLGDAGFFGPQNSLAVDLLNVYLLFPLSSCLQFFFGRETARDIALLAIFTAPIAMLHFVICALIDSVVCVFESAVSPFETIGEGLGG